MPAASEVTNCSTGPDATRRADCQESWANSPASAALPADAINSAAMYSTSSAVHAPSRLGPVAVSTTVASSNSRTYDRSVSISGSLAIKPTVQPSKGRARPGSSPGELGLTRLTYIQDLGLSLERMFIMENVEPKQPRTRRAFTAEFKAEIVEFAARRSSDPIDVMADHLGGLGVWGQVGLCGGSGWVSGGAQPAIAAWMRASRWVASCAGVRVRSGRHSDPRAAIARTVAAVPSAVEAVMAWQMVSVLRCSRAPIWGWFRTAFSVST